MCPKLPEVAHGEFTRSQDVLAPKDNTSDLNYLGKFEITELQCDDGYFATGNNRTFCNHHISNAWLLELPECKRKLLENSNTSMLGYIFRLNDSHTNLVI